MLNKDSIKTLVANSLYSFHDEILKDEFATKKYVDDKISNIADAYTLLYPKEVDGTTAYYDIYNLPLGDYRIAQQTNIKTWNICVYVNNIRTQILSTTNSRGFSFTIRTNSKFSSNKKPGRMILIDVFSIATGGEIFTFAAYDDGNVEIRKHQATILSANTETEFTPTKDYHPTTKKYVDDTANTLVKKDTNKYVLITNDDTLIIKKDSITDIADATITIDNLTGKFGTLVANDNGTYSYTLNTIMTDVETFIFKVNNVEQKLVIVPYKEMTYDDKNAGITYEGNWYEDTNDKYYKKSSHYTKGSDNSISKISFIFTGTAVKFIGMVSKALGKNRTMTSIYKINNDVIDAEASYASVSSNTITSTDIIMYNSCVSRAEFFNQMGFSKCKAELTSGKGSTTYIDRIVIYNTIQNLNDSIESLYNQRESMSNVLRTDIPNGVFVPKELYDPATKDYVDKTVAAGKIAMCTDEEIDNMLNEVLGGDYSGN